MGFGGFERFEGRVNGCLVGYSRTMGLGLALRSGRLSGLVVNGIGMALAWCHGF